MGRGEKGLLGDRGSELQLRRRERGKRGKDNKWGGKPPPRKYDRVGHDMPHIMLVGRDNLLCYSVSADSVARQ